MIQINNLVNKFGKMAGWNSATWHMYGRNVEGISEFGYDDNITKENVYGAGRMPIGFSEGAYECNVNVTLYQEEVIAIMDSLPPGVRLQDAVPVDIVVVYEYRNRLYKDVIRNFQINGVGKSLSQGDGTVTQTLECMCSHIDWNV